MILRTRFFASFFFVLYRQNLSLITPFKNNTLYLCLLILYFHFFFFFISFVWSKEIVLIIRVLENSVKNLVLIKKFALYLHKNNN